LDYLLLLRSYWFRLRQVWLESVIYLKWYYLISSVIRYRNPIALHNFEGPLSRLLIIWSLRVVLWLWSKTTLECPFFLQICWSRDFWSRHNRRSNTQRAETWRCDSWFLILPWFIGSSPGYASVSTIFLAICLDENKSIYQEAL